MERLFVKKSIHSNFEAIFVIAVLNIFYVACCAISIFILPKSFIVFAIMLLFSYLFSLSTFTLCPISKYKVVIISDIFTHLKEAIIPGLQFFLFSVITLILAIACIQFYSNIGGFIAWFLLFFSMWIILFIILGLQFFLPLKALYKKDFVWSIKTAFTILFNCPYLSISLLLMNIARIVLCPLIAFLFPGFSSTTLTSCDATTIAINYVNWKNSTDTKEALKKSGKRFKAFYLDNIENVFKSELQELDKKTFKDLLFPWRKIGKKQ